MTPFFCLKKITYTSQPAQSQWCWAACLSNFIKHYELDSEIGKCQCNLVSYYKQFLIENGHEFDNENTECCSKDSKNECPKNIPNGCNIGMKDSHFKHMIKKVGLKCEVSTNTTPLESFEHIVTTLKKNKCPIILKTNQDYAHDVMIVGFGKLRECKYILISDPKGSAGEKYLNLDEYRELLKHVEKIWEIKGLKNTTTLKIGEILVNDFTIREAQIQSIKSNYGRDFTCPSLEREIITAQNAEGSIKQIILNQKWNNSITIKNGKMFINDYSYFGNYRLKKGKLIVKPISFPGDYELKNEWMKYEDLQSQLSNVPTTKKFFIN